MIVVPLDGKALVAMLRRFDGVSNGKWLNWKLGFSQLIHYSSTFQYLLKNEGVLDVFPKQPTFHLNDFVILALGFFIWKTTQELKAFLDISSVGRLRNDLTLISPKKHVNVP